MKILKMYVSRKYGPHYYCVFDEIPEVTYEKVGMNYEGSAVDENGNVIFSNMLGYENMTGAFGGRELTLKMKDGSEAKIKDHWWDWGHCRKHGEFVDIGADTIKGLQRCYVYSGMNINKHAFQLMLEDYYSREKEYEYYEIEEWVERQRKWHQLQISGKKIPFMVSENGTFAEMYTKKRIHPTERKIISKYQRAGKTENIFRMELLKLEYEEITEPYHTKKKVRSEHNLFEVLKESLPMFSEDEIVNKFGLQVSGKVEKRKPTNTFWGF